MLRKFESNYEIIKHRMLFKKPIFYIGNNNVNILVLEGLSYSIKKDDIDSLKLYCELNGICFEEYPFSYHKYSKILEKRARNGEIWFFQDFGNYSDKYITLYNFKTNMIQNKNEEDYFLDEIYAAAQKLGYRIHLNEKPECWNKYSNGLY